MKWPNFLRADGGAPTLGTFHQAEPQQTDTGRHAMPPESERTVTMRQPRLQGGWKNAKGLGHMCLPPDAYEEGWGPGSVYVCIECGCPWQSVGIRSVSSEYRWYGHGTKIIIGPKQYIFVGQLLEDNPSAGYRDADGSPICPVIMQQGFYDWRDPSEVMCQQLDRLSTITMAMSQNLRAILEMPKVVNFDPPISTGRHSEGADAGRDEGGR